jgi:hypothetical protein
MAHVDWLGDVQKTNHKIVNSMYYKTTISIPITKKNAQPKIYNSITFKGRGEWRVTCLVY